MLTEVSEKIGYEETVTNIIPLLEPLSKDTEPVVKQHLVEQMKLLAKVIGFFSKFVDETDLNN